MIDEYKAEDVKPRNVYPQSFDIRDIRYWIAKEPEFGKQAVYLDDANVVAELPSAAQLAAYKAEGINIVAPPIFALLEVDDSGNIAHPGTPAMPRRRDSTSLPGPWSALASSPTATTTFITRRSILPSSVRVI